ncbi:MAG: hypothetical protein DRJ38_07965 [Thermoprotei archaeon]|nr:MAG: hypothetical protein DRJ38_07965 [Thermoprotei archaeon]
MSYLNLRAYKKEIIPHIKPVSGETFGAELLVNASLKNYKIKEITYNPPPRRTKPKIGGTTKANIKILTATLRLLKIVCIAINNIITPRFY